MPPRARTDRAVATRELILDAAERLFATHGVYAVSNRQIAEAAGQGNTAVVGYHFGTKTDLVRALTARHSAAIERARLAALERVEGSTQVRDWVDCLVLPQAEHLDSIGVPSWSARFAAQVDTDPVLRSVLSDEALSSPSLQRILDGLDDCLPSLPPEVHLERRAIARLLMVHVLAERERALDVGDATPRSSWSEAAAGLVDAIVAVWLAPVSVPPAS